MSGLADRLAAVRPDMSAADRDRLAAALTTVQDALAFDEVLVLVGSGMFVSSRSEHANGTYQVTAKRRDSHDTRGV